MHVAHTQLVLDIHLHRVYLRLCRVHAVACFLGVNQRSRQDLGGRQVTFLCRLLQRQRHLELLPFNFCRRIRSWQQQQQPQRGNGGHSTAVETVVTAQQQPPPQQLQQQQCKTTQVLDMGFRVSAQGQKQRLSALEEANHRRREQMGIRVLIRESCVYDVRELAFVVC